MATSDTKPAPAKQLKEHLQEQQEPFKLSTYLFERRKSPRKLTTNGEDNSRSSLSKCTSSNLKEPCSSNLLKKQVLHSPKSLKSLLYKLITPNEKQGPKAGKEKLVSETIDMLQHIAETNWFSTAGNVDSFSADLGFGDEILVADASHALNAKHSEEEKVCTKNGAKKGDKQLILATVRLDLESVGASSSSIISRQANGEGEPLFSAYLLKPLVTSLTEKHIQDRITRAIERVESGSKIKRVLPPSKRLLFDCMQKTVISNVRNYKRQKHLHKFLSIEELGSIISSQLCSLGKQLVNATNAAAAHMITLDFSNTAQEWNHFQQTKLQICREMGDSIINEIIKETIDLQ